MAARPTEKTNGKNHDAAADLAAPPAGGEQAAPQVRLDDSDVSAIYANFCRISGTPEELILDFALNNQPSGAMPEVLKLDQRVIMNFYTAKRLLGALHMAVQRHEATFGPLETDIRKRVHPAAGRSN